MGLKGVQNHNFNQKPWKMTVLGKSIDLISQKLSINYQINLLMGGHLHKMAQFFSTFSPTFGKLNYLHLFKSIILNICIFKVIQISFLASYTTSSNYIWVNLWLKNKRSQIRVEDQLAFHIVIMNQESDSIGQSLLQARQVKYKDYDFIWKVIVNISLASTYSGYCLGYFNTINFDDTIKIFSLQADRALMQGSLTFCVAIGAGIGGYYANQIISRYSRRQCFLIVVMVAIVTTLMLQTKVVFAIFICRIVQGITVGLSTVLRITYIKQFVPLELAGKFGALNQVFFAIGLIFTFTIAYVLSLTMEVETYWRVIYGFPVLFLGIQAYNLVYTFPYDTPKYLLEHNRREEAVELVKLIYKPEYVEERVAELQKHISISEVKDKEMMPIGEIKSSQSSPKQLTSNKVAIFVAYHSSVLQQISGIQVIILYTGEIMLSIQPRLQKIVPLIIQVEGLIASLYSMKLVDTHGRKELIQFGLMTMGSAHIVVAFCFLLEQLNGDEHPTASLFQNVIIVIGLLFCRWMFSMTIGPITWLYLPQVVEPAIAGVATMLNWVAAASVSFIYPIIVEIVGSPCLIFFLFGLSVLIGHRTNEKWMVETKGKPEWQIRQEYDEKLKDF